MTISAICLGIIHGKIRHAQDFLIFVAVTGDQADADRRTDNLADTADCIRLVDRLQNFGAAGIDRIDIFEPVENDRKFVATDTCGKILWTDNLGDPVGDFPQQRVAAVMTARVIDNFETIQVQQQQGGFAISLLAIFNSRFDILCEQYPIGKTRQHVVQGEVRSMFFGKLSGGDINGGRQDADRFTLVIEQRRFVAMKNEIDAIARDFFFVMRNGEA